MIASPIKSTMRLASVLITLVLIFPLLSFAGDSAGYDFESILLGDCLVGNLNPPVAPPVPGIFMGDEAYAYLIFPADQCNCSEEGFVLESITQFLFFEDQQVPANLIVQGALLGADFDPSIGCWVPGPLLYEGPQEIFDITTHGEVVIQVPTPGSPALPLADHYFLVLRYQGGAEGMLVVDDQPMQCVEFINRGAGWEDLNDFGKSGGGKVIVFGDIVCSPMVVPSSSETWDAVKSLYK